MNSKFLVCSILSAILFFSCKWDKKTDVIAEAKSKNLSALVLDSISVNGPITIINGDSSSSKVLIQFPKSLGIGGAEQAIIQNIKQRQFESITASLFLEEGMPKPKDLPEAINAFIKSSEVDPSDKQADFIGYAYESLFTEKFIGKEIVCYSLNDYIYTGGAHPTTMMEILNFDKATGQLIDIKKIAEDTVALKTIVQKAFEANEKAELGKDFDLKNYYFEDGFVLPQNFGITNNGLECFYNPYEIAAYARGPISFSIPWKDLQGVITKYVPLDDVKLGDDLQ
jgi:hypothetical protein